MRYDDGTEVPDQTEEEIAQIRTNAINATHYPSWVWNEEAVKYIPPIAFPTDGLPYLWDEDTTGWVAFS